MISRAASILRVLGQDTSGLSLGQIAHRVNLPRSTVQRIVTSLSEEGFVATGGGSGRIRLGPEIQSLAQAASNETQARLRPIMRRIAQATGETVDLAVLKGGRMLFVDQIMGSQRLRAVSSIGESFPLTTTANGKAALSCMDEIDATDLILTELRQTKGGPKLAELLAEIEAIRAGDLARDADEHTSGVSALGFGLKDGAGDVFAISIPVPSSRFAAVSDRLERVLKEARAHTLQGGS